MMPEIFKRLYIHNDWANGQALDAAARLSPEAYDEKVGPGWGSVGATLAHVADADRVWLRRWQGERGTVNPDDPAYAELPSLRAAWTATMAKRQDFLDNLTEASLRAPIAYRNTKGDAFSQPLWELLYHVLLHSADHRGHLAVMLTEHGQPTPPMDFVFWARKALET
jgi:uncharacterized damage-inducible protein DinB